MSQLEPSITIRALQGEEMLDVLYAFTSYAFHASPPLREREAWEQGMRGRMDVSCHVLYEDGQATASAVSTPMTQNVRGRLYPAGGVWGVVTVLKARRKGYCRRTLASLLAAERAGGRVFSNLYPFRESFYERLGYVSFPRPLVARFSPAALQPLLGQDLGGQIELQLSGEAFERGRAYLAQMRPQVHGMAFFDQGNRVFAGRNTLWAAFASFEGQDEGMLYYNLRGEEVTNLAFKVERFYYRTGRARALLLEWIARHIDQAGSVEMRLAPGEHPELWLADLGVMIETQPRAPMSRVLNVAALGGMRCGPGSFDAHILDPLLLANQGAWRFESQDGRLHVSPSERADFNLTIQGLTALLFGAHTPQELSLRGWGDPSPEQQARLAQFFPPALPYLHEWF